MVILMLPEAPAISTEVQVEATESQQQLWMEVLAVEVRDWMVAAEVVDTVAAAVAVWTLVLAEVADPFLRPRHRVP